MRELSVEFVSLVGGSDDMRVDGFEAENELDCAQLLWDLTQNE